MQKTIRHWNSTHYLGETSGDADAEFEISVQDQLDSNGQMYIDVSPKGGNVDDLMALCVEINHLPETETPVPCLHVHFDSNNLAFSLFKSGTDQFLLRPERGVRLKEIRVDGEIAYQIEGDAS
ncbi:MAG: hypothetical protein M0003_09830 [Acidithiobacillus sp.]|jgi:hypothetical protein|uniref:hypothetical protein n=1 Tax=Acidithiobacillus ferrooxidans TaxID=920 RepID=UPI000A419159|nr:hypothetical protein [Acidithiobacillus ferrooxidans]MDA8152993.1 hypothetical protein [Acidithiobacillus sp.]